MLMTGLPTHPRAEVNFEELGTPTGLAAVVEAATLEAGRLQ